MNRYKDLRKKFNLTQSQLANKINIEQSTVSKWEQNRTIPDIATLTKLSELYNVSIDYLCGREEKNKFENLTKDQEEIFELILKLNQLNFVRAYSYVSGLYVSQESN